MNVNGNGYFAGDINLPNNGCGRGVDCSGFVSNAWGLSDHVGTSDLGDPEYSVPVNDYQYLLKGDILLKTSSPAHVILFDSFGHIGEEQGMYGFEATTNNYYDRLVFSYRSFSSLSEYGLRRYINVCDGAKIKLPLIMNDETAQILGDNTDIPYPPPYSDFDAHPYPYPEP